MKKFLRQLFHALTLASLVGSLAFTVGAAPATQTGAGSAAVIRFDMIGEKDTLLRGPFATKTARFGLPANWAFQSGASLKLIITSTFVSGSGNGVPNGQFIGSTLGVAFNGNDIATIPLLAGPDVTYDIPIPPSALNTKLNDGRHELELFLDAGNDCNDPNRHTSIVLSAASHFTIPYTEQTPTLDLTTLPRPIFQRDSIFPVNSTIIVPNTPTAQELQAALTVASTFGRMSNGEMTVNLVPMNQMTPEMRTDSQLIFVGKSSTLSLLQGVALPSPVQGRAFTAPGMEKDDGILQMAVSPWNTGRSLLVVGGNTDLGVVKAAQALSNQNIQTVGDHKLALIANVIAPTGPIGTDTTLPQQTQTLADLGYGILSMNGVGRSEATVRFSLPPGYVAAEDTYLDLTFNHSGLLDFSRSGLTVFMNRNLIGSVLLSDQTSSTVTQRIKIPAASLVTSGNELKFESDLAPISQCSFMDFSNLWLSVLPESVLNIPLRPATAGAVQLRDLSSYPYPFAGEPTLSTTAFVVSKTDPSTWDAASKIALQLGRQSSGALFNLAVAYDGELSDEIRNGRDLIVIGLPSETKLLAEIKDSLPAPFEAGSNVAVLQGQQVAYRFPADSDLGFLQLLASPWNADRVIMVVAGTTPIGVQQSAQTLTNPLLLSRIKGNFVLVNGESLSVADTRTGLGLASVSESADVTARQIPGINTTAVPETAPGSAFASEMDWIPLVVAGLAIAIVIVLIIAAVTRRRTIPG